MELLKCGFLRGMAINPADVQRGFRRTVAFKFLVARPPDLLPVGRVAVAAD